MALLERQSGLLRKEVELFRSATQTGSPTDWLRPKTLIQESLEEILALGIFVFERIGHADELSRAAIFGGKLPYDPAQEKEIEEHYREWADIAKSCLTVLGLAEGNAIPLAGAARFRDCYHEVEGILTSDEDFFQDDALVELRDQALETHRRGESTDMEGRRN
jgi:hypothetical protein